MAEIRWTEEAHRWLRDIFDYIAADNPESAREVAAGIYERVQDLRRFPEIGYKYRSEPEGEIRILLYGHYRMAYLINMAGQIDILGVFHSALDIDMYSTLALKDKHALSGFRLCTASQNPFLKSSVLIRGKIRSESNVENCTSK
jgi:toxin ParE1/3/4